MPKAPSSTPEKLKPYIFHGVDLSWGKGDDNAIGDCPWCGRSGKFSVLISTGQWRCFVCGEGSDKGGGNASTFVKLLWEESKQATKENDYAELAKDRKLHSTLCLKKWGVAKSVLTFEWLIPAFNSDGVLTTLYKKGKAPYPTPTLGHHLHGVNLFRKSKPKVYVCEGPWDGIAWWEAMWLAKMLEDANVLAVPGCETFNDNWLKLLKDKDVVLCYDSDHPRKHPKTGKRIEPAGFKAVKRVSSVVNKAASSVSYLKWGDDGFDPDLPSGADVRDYLAGQTGA